MANKSLSNPSNITYEDFEFLIKSPHIETEELTNILEKEVGIEINQDLERDEILDQVWNKFQEALTAYNQEKKKHIQDEKLIKRNNKSKSSSKGGKQSRKQFIIGLIREGKYNKEQIIRIVSDEYNYAQEGKTPNTRISKVIKELKDNNYLHQSADGVLSIKQ